MPYGSYNTGDYVYIAFKNNLTPPNKLMMSSTFNNTLSFSSSSWFNHFFKQISPPISISNLVDKFEQDISPDNIAKWWNRVKVKVSNNNPIDTRATGGAAECCVII
jgi:hypothetical protein